MLAYLFINFEHVFAFMDSCQKIAKLIRKYFLKVFENLTWQKCISTTFNNILLLTFLLTQGLFKTHVTRRKAKKGVWRKSGKKSQGRGMLYSPEYF